MTSLEGFQEHLSIISKVVCCGCYLKNNLAFTLQPTTLVYLYKSLQTEHIHLFAQKQHYHTI